MPSNDLNLSYSVGDDPGAVSDNMARLCAAISVDESMVVRTQQIHSNRVNVVSTRAEGLVGDGLATRARGLWLAVSVADCLPMYFFDEQSRAAGIAHAGWRGTLQGISSECVMQMKGVFGCDPAQMLALMGPGIGPCCFEVSDETAQRFVDLCPDSVSGNRVDLFKANRWELEKLGVRCLVSDTICTSCNEDLFFSHRRDKGLTGRMLALIGT